MPKKNSKTIKKQGRPAIDPPGQLGRLIRDAMKTRNVTQYETAQESNVAQGTLSDWIRGKYMPEIAGCCRVASFLEIDLIELSEAIFADANEKDTN